jgi:hypothetical protein
MAGFAISFAYITGRVLNPHVGGCPGGNEFLYAAGSLAAGPAYLGYSAIIGNAKFLSAELRLIADVAVAIAAITGLGWLGYSIPKM